MSHKTLLKRFRGEASTSTAVDPGEREHAENIPMEIGEPDEPDPPPRRPRERLSQEELKRLRKKYSMHHATVERKQKKYDWQYQCMNCVKRFDDIVRKVHDDLLAGRITMVGVTLTRKVPIKTRNRRVQTSPERVQPVPKQMKPERMQHVSEEMRPMQACMQTATEEMDAVREQMHFMPERMQTAIEERNAVREQMHFMPERMQAAIEERNAVREQMHFMPDRMQTAIEERNAVREQMHFMPERMQTAIEERNAVREQMHFMPERMQPVPEPVHTLPEPLDLMLKQMRAMSERMVPDTEPMHHVPDRVETSSERDDSRDNSLTRDFCGGTDPSQLERRCQCNKCLVEHNANTNVRASRTKSRNHVSRIHLNRAHSPCKDNALIDLHQHVLAGDEKTPGSRYVGILSSLHDQGPCEVPCKLRSDVVWMHDHIPKQAETQTDLTGDYGVRDQGTQTNLVRSIGIQKGEALAQKMAARSAHFKSASTQLNLPELPPIHRPVGKVLPIVIRNRF